MKDCTMLYRAGGGTNLHRFKGDRTLFDTATVPGKEVGTFLAEGWSLTPAEAEKAASEAKEKAEAEKASAEAAASQSVKPVKSK